MPNRQRTADDYLSLFEAWDIALRLRTEPETRRTIEAIQESECQPAEWSLIGSWLSVRDILFFQEVLTDSHLRGVLATHGFAPPRLHGRQKSDNDFLILTKPSWTVCPDPNQLEGVNVHIECKHRGEVQLHIELHPYEGSVGKNPGRLAALRKQLELKADLHRAVRRVLHERVRVDPSLGVSQKGLRAPDALEACLAAKFTAGSGKDCTPQEHAAFAAKAIDAVTPTVDSVLQASTCVS